MEISPLALATCEDIALRVVACGGAALLVDYGEDFTQEDTLRAYLKHKQVSVLSQVRGMLWYVAHLRFITMK
jgi:SAM-dependent MidA family methyltransferase